LAAEKPFFGGGYNLKTGQQVTIPAAGAYTSMPYPFWGAKDVCYIEKKVTK
tara:strand:+ start:446 stop:598 length:153 start_codon:yes stop_codon:yes gene_type:complete